MTPPSSSELNVATSQLRAEPVRCPVCESAKWKPLYRRLGWLLVRCERCGLRRLDPLPTEDELAAHYSLRSESGNYEPAKADERLHGLRQVLDFTERSAAGRGRLFDIGCFDGGFLDLATDRGWDGWGLELQADAANEAERKHPGRVHHGTLESHNDIPANFFDAITAIGLVEHLRDPTRLFELAHLSLRPGGVLVIQTPNQRSLPARLLRRYWPPIAPPEHTFYFDSRTLRTISCRYGLAPIDSRPHVKLLRIGYAYEQFEHFGPELHRLLGPVARRLPRTIMNLRVPLYGGELLFCARRDA